ncbi:MAG: NAD-dependent epimerase/dehydratase family protein, partial [Candidatus Margulisbacteria bacterium]|nr:NAD-dependent epimerase/dehydratase family protein [Candidatus Margulisiibacteriota bacterium]
DRNSVQQAMKGIDVVHHNVALVPLTKSGNKFWDVNVTGSKIAAEEAVRAGVSYFIHMSSSAIYGIPVEEPITLTTPYKPIEIYGKGKLAGEQAVRETCESAGLPLVVIRPRTILGQGRLGIFKILFDWVHQNRNIYVIGKGDHLFQFVHANDLIDAYLLAMDQQKPGVYNVGTDKYGTLREVLETLIQCANSKSKVKSLPTLLTINSLRMLDIMGLSPLAPWHYLTYHKPFYFDVSPLLDLGWNPTYSNDDMFKESYEWFLAHLEDEVEEIGSMHRRPLNEKLLTLLKKVS